MLSAVARNLEPKALVDLCASLERLQFGRKVPAPVLLVRVDDREGELFSTLRELAESSVRESIPPTIGFQTESDLHNATTLGTRTSNRPLAFSEHHVASRLGRQLHYAIPILKRGDGGKSFSERVSVGRAKNNDVVLRHPSVSKFHASFRRDDDDQYYVSDAGSRNGTSHNGVKLAPNRPTRASAGDVLLFGLIEAMIVPAETLWSALR